MKKRFFIHLLFILVVLGFLIASTNFYYAWKYPLKYESSIASEASANQLDPDFICAVICVESHFRENAISDSGAMGLMQLMPLTAIFMAEEIGLTSFSIDDLYHPTTNIRLGCKYLRYLKDKYGNVKTMLACYNAGEGNVMAWLLSPEYSLDGLTLETTPYPETNYYINEVMEVLKIYRKKRDMKYLFLGF